MAKECKSLFYQDNNNLYGLLLSNPKAFYKDLLLKNCIYWFLRN